jgi:tight adherence protein C
MSAVFLSTAAATVIASVAAVMIIHEIHLRALNARVSKVVMGVPGQFARFGALTKWLASLGARYHRFYSPENLDQLRTIVQTSGFNPHRTMPILIGGKTVSMFLFPIIAWFAAQFSGASFNDALIFAAFGAVVGIMGPRLLLGFIRRRFNAAVQRGTPDAIDLLVVCSEAGMGLESGLARVAQEMNRSNPAVTKVLNGLLDDLRILPNRRDAFENLSKRSTTEGLRRFGTMINQSLQYGTPLGHALRAIAEELRRERIIKLEERAHKLGAKLILPMVLFLLPAMFVILGGSSFLHLTRAFK